MTLRVNLKAILDDPEKRRELMVAQLMAMQNREGIPTTREQAEAAYDKVRDEQDFIFAKIKELREEGWYDPDFMARQVVDDAWVEKGYDFQFRQHLIEQMIQGAGLAGPRPE